MATETSGIPPVISPWFFPSLVVLVTGAILASGVSSLLISALGEVHTRASELELAGKTDENLAAREAADHSSLEKNSRIGLGIVGATLASCLGLATGLVFRTVRGTVIGAISGLLLGGSLGYLGALIEVSVQKSLLTSPEMDPLVKGMIAHSIGWGMIAIAIGVSTGAATERQVSLLRTIGAALLGAVLGGMLFDPLGSFLFPLSRTDLVVPDRTDPSNCRIFWIALTGVPTALLLAWTYSHRSPAAAGESTAA